MSEGSLGQEIVNRISALAAISAEPDKLTRLFLSIEHRKAAELILSWMRDAGMHAKLDAVGNVIGRYEGNDSKAPCLMLGSHFDTVRDAGKWDGPLGLVAAISCVSELNRRGARFPFAIEVAGFADEEGVRFSSTLLGSRAVAGTFQMDVLESRDGDNVSMRDAMIEFGLDPNHIGAAARARNDLCAYVELHIEQGPVLEDVGLPVGVVTAISGATRFAVSLTGMAGHAGTVPMLLRRDALAGAAECIVAIEAICRTDEKLVGTVGYINASPGATNVIPGQVSFTIDVRSPSEAHRKLAAADIARTIENIACDRQLSLQIDVTHENRTVPCALWLRRRVSEAISAEGYRVLELASGAGHDGMAIVDIADIGMIFVRCRGGLSHHPEEHVDQNDVEASARVLLRFIESFECSDMN